MKMHWSYKSKYGKINKPIKRTYRALEWIHIVQQQEWLKKGLIKELVYTIDEFNEMIKDIKEPK